MPSRLFSDAEEKQLISQYTNSTISVRHLAQQIGCAPRSLLSIFERHHVDTHYRGRSNLYTFDYQAFDNLEHELPVYWLGFIYADGYVRPKPPTLMIILSAKDRDHLEKLRNFLSTEQRLAEQTDTKGYEKVGLYLTNNHFSIRLQELGILIGRPSISKAVSQIPPDMIHHFIRGLFDGDGHALKKKPGIDFAGSFDTLAWVRQLFTSLFCLPEGKTIRQNSKSNQAYSLRYEGRNLTMKIVSWLYQDASVWLERKYETFQHHLY